MLDLARYPRVKGIVVHGDKRGAALGFPTANLALPPETPPPPQGVYCCLARLSARPRLIGATTSIGNNPTFPDVEEIRVEAYLHDFDGNLYGEMIELILLHRIRDMCRFDSVAALVAQTERDVAESRSLLDGALGLPAELT